MCVLKEVQRFVPSSDAPKMVHLLIQAKKAEEDSEPQGGLGPGGAKDQKSSSSEKPPMPPHLLLFLAYAVQ